MGYSEEESLERPLYRRYYKKISKRALAAPLLLQHAKRFVLGMANLPLWWLVLVSVLWLVLEARIILESCLGILVLRVRWLLRMGSSGL